MAYSRSNGPTEVEGFELNPSGGHSSRILQWQDESLARPSREIKTGIKAETTSSIARSHRNKRVRPDYSRHERFEGSNLLLQGL